MDTRVRNSPLRSVLLLDLRMIYTNALPREDQAPHLRTEYAFAGKWDHEEALRDVPNKRSLTTDH